MASPFDADLSACDALFDATFGARIRIVPMAGSTNARPGPDPARAPWEGIAVVSAAPLRARPEDPRGTGREDRFGTTSAVTVRTVSVTRSALAVDVAEGDRVSLLDEAGVPVLKVSRVERADPTRLVLHLV